MVVTLRGFKMAYREEYSRPGHNTVEAVAEPAGARRRSGADAGHGAFRPACTGCRTSAGQRDSVAEPGPGCGRKAQVSQEARVVRNCGRRFVVRRVRGLR